MKYIILAAIVLLAIFIIILTKIPIGIEPLTELYFENHTKLPKYLFPNRSYNFSFTVNNLEYQQMDYEYKVIIEYQNKTINLDNKNFTLPYNETETFYEKFSMPKNFEKAKLTVYLYKQTENPMQRDPNMKNITLDIHFWMEEIVGVKIITIPD